MNLPTNARLMSDGTIRLPDRGKPQQYEGWIQSDRNPRVYYPETVDCAHRLRLIEELPCCGKVSRMKCNAISINGVCPIPITYKTCLTCQGTEEGISALQRKVNENADS